MIRMHAIVHAAARLPVADAASARLLRGLVARDAGFARQRYAAGTLPSRFRIA